MLPITIPLGPEEWDPEKEEFVEPKTITLQLEHSLVSLSKWEAKHCTPFLAKKNFTIEETVDYIKCMTITQNVNPDVYRYLTNDNIDEIKAYIDSPMTATTFPEDKTAGRGREIVTNEVIYHWMISLNIPFSCEKWHLNRLLTLVKVCSIKNSPPKKMSKREIMSRNAAMNAARKKQLNSKG